MKYDFKPKTTFYEDQKQNDKQLIVAQKEIALLSKMGFPRNINLHVRNLFGTPYLVIINQLSSYGSYYSSQN